MKSRLIILVRRLGSVFLVMGLALTIVAMMPVAPSGNVGSSRLRLTPGKYDIDYLYWGLSSFSGLHISITSNSKFQIFLLAMSPHRLTKEIFIWMLNNDPNTNETHLGSGMDNVSVLEAFISLNPGVVLCNETVAEEWSIDFFPPRITNVSIVYSNIFNVSINAKMDFNVITAIAPRERVIFSAIMLIILGVGIFILCRLQKGK